MRLLDALPPHLRELVQALPTIGDPAEHAGLQRIVGLGRTSRFRVVDYVCAAPRSAHRLGEVLLTPEPVLVLHGLGDTELAEWARTASDIYRDGAVRHKYRGRSRAIAVADLSVVAELLPNVSGMTRLACRHGRHRLDLQQVAGDVERRAARVLLATDRTA